MTEYERKLNLVPDDSAKLKTHPDILDQQRRHLEGLIKDIPLLEKPTPFVPRKPEPPTPKHQGWIGVDLDGTLAHYEGWQGVEHIGHPIPEMLERVKQWVREGRDVRIFTARAYRMLYPLGTPEYDESVKVIERIHEWLEWCGLPKLPVTCFKDFGMVELWDDRCVQVTPNTGRRADGKH